MGHPVLYDMMSYTCCLICIFHSYSTIIKESINIPLGETDSLAVFKVKVKPSLATNHAYILSDNTLATAGTNTSRPHEYAD